MITNARSFPKHRISTMLLAIVLFSSFVPSWMDAPTSAPSIRRRGTTTQTRQIYAYSQKPPMDAFPLQLCEGDCGDDEDCETGLYCFQRFPNDPVPGCIGGDSDNSRTDYCTDGRDDNGNAISSPPTLPPTPYPTITPTTEAPVSTPYPVLSTPAPYLENMSNPQINAYRGRPPQTAFPLGLCRGDCRDDSECEIGLYCFQRGPDEPIPGCAGGPTDHSRTDYCTDVPPHCWESPCNDAPPLPTTSPTTSMTPSDVASTDPTPNPGSISIPRPKVYPLQQCQGDCLWHEDCDDGMFCFQRDPYESVPGCSGGENDGTKTDYCTYIPPVVAPVEPPTTDNFRIKMFWNDYYWQEEKFDRVWCMQCKDGCEQGELMFLHYCAWDSARFDFLEIMDTDHVIQISVVDTDLCLERSGTSTSLEICNSDEPLQYWKTTEGSFDGDYFFEFIQYIDDEEYCVTTHHHPKYGEVIELFPCNVARYDTTSYWTKY